MHFRGRECLQMLARTWLPALTQMLALNLDLTWICGIVADACIDTDARTYAHADTLLFC